MNTLPRLRRLVLVACCSLLLTLRIVAAEKPNVIIIFADDLGYADLACYGSKSNQTTNLDRLAREGKRFTNFHVAQPVCSASRAALLTGCYPNRIGIHGALGPNARDGIAASETTLPEIFKGAGYATGMAGKWHLGHHKQFLPTQHGFDEYLGIPYSNDMWPYHPERPDGYPPLPLLDNSEPLKANVTPADQRQFSRLFTERCIDFIKRKKDAPFFFYLAHPQPHVPLFTSEAFDGKTKAGKM